MTQSVFFVYTGGSDRLRNFYPDPRQWRVHLENMLEDAVLQGVELGRKKSHSPYLTGWLAGGIHMQGPHRGAGGVEADLAIDEDTVPYAEVQEHFNPRKSLYLFRATIHASRVLERHCAYLRELDSLMKEGRRGREPVFTHAGREDLKRPISVGKKPIRRLASRKRFRSREEFEREQRARKERQRVRISARGDAFKQKFSERVRRFVNRERRGGVQSGGLD